jgi:hypothetical protein
MQMRTGCRAASASVHVGAALASAFDGGRVDVEAEEQENEYRQPTSRGDT